MAAPLRISHRKTYVMKIGKIYPSGFGKKVQTIDAWCGIGKTKDALVTAQ